MPIDTPGAILYLTVMKETLKSRTRLKYLTLLFALVLAGIVVIANLGYGGTLFSAARAVPHGDKICHFILMGLLSFFVNTAFSARRFRIMSVSVLKGSFLVFAIVTAEEFSQLFLEYRTFSLSDLVSDYAGILLFGRLAFWIEKRRISNTPAASA